MCLGHESSGIIVRLGFNVASKASEAEKSASLLSANDHVDKPVAKAVVGRRAFNVGDRVTLEPGTSCRMCADCIRGQYQVCRDIYARHMLIGEVMRTHGVCGLPPRSWYSSAILQAVDIVRFLLSTNMLMVPVQQIACIIFPIRSSSYTAQ